MFPHEQEATLSILPTNQGPYGLMLQHDTPQLFVSYCRTEKSHNRVSCNRSHLIFLVHSHTSQKDDIHMHF